MSLPFVNRGQPFVLTRGMVSPVTFKAALAAQLHAFKDAVSGISDLPEKAQQEVMQKAEMVAGTAMMHVTVHGVLATVDPKLAELPTEDVMSQLTMADVLRISNAVGRNPAGKESPVPLAHTAP